MSFFFSSLGRGAITGEVFGVQFNAPSYLVDTILGSFSIA